MAVLRVPQDYATIVDAAAAANTNDTIIIDASYAGISRATLNVSGVTVIAPASLSDITIALGTRGDSVILGGESAMVAVGNSNANSLTGNSAANYLRGDRGDDMLDGGGGNDWADYRSAAGDIQATLTDATAPGGPTGGFSSGADGADTLINIENLHGGTFNDTLTGNSSNNVLVGGLGDDTLDGGAGNDLVTYYLAVGAVAVTLTDGANGHTGGFTTGADGADTLIDIENVNGTNFNDVITGNSGNNVFAGHGGSDTIDGGGGVDRADYLGEASVTVVLTDGAGGHTGGTAASGADIDALIDIEDVRGTEFNDSITGNSAANSLIGREGADVLSGGGGDDVLLGGPGADNLDGGAGADLVSYLGAAAGATVNLETGSGSGGEAQGDVLANIENVLGTSFQDFLIGKAGVANILDGGNGADFLYGEGLDTFIGGGGVDAVFGAPGAALNLDLFAGSIEIAWGGFLSDTLNGALATSNLTLVGQGPTADTMSGGSGADFIYFRAGDIISGGAGNDWAVASLSAVGVSLDLAATGFENSWGSTSADTLTGAGAIATVVLVGDAGADALTGGSGADFLYGGLGDDTLNGGGGNDNLVGDAGTDIFRFGVNWGVDIVWGWENGTEKFNLAGSGATSFAQLVVNQNVAGNSGNALISFGANQILVVGGANMIDAGDFIFD